MWSCLPFPKSIPVQVFGTCPCSSDTWPCSSRLLEIQDEIFPGWDFSRITLSPVMFAQKCPTKTCLSWRKDLSALQFYWGLFNLHHWDMKSDGLNQVCSDLGLENNCVPWTFLYQNFLLPALCHLFHLLAHECSEPLCLCSQLWVLPRMRFLYQSIAFPPQLMMQHEFIIITCLFWLLFVCWWNLLSAMGRSMLRSGYFKLMPFKGFQIWDTCLSVVAASELLEELTSSGHKNASPRVTVRFGECFSSTS